MLVCNVSQLARRAAIAADLAETAAAEDNPGTGNVVLATLVDDPAAVDELVDAYLGQVMLETATATDSVDGGIPGIFAADLAETATAAETQDATAGAALPISGVIGWWDASVLASINKTGSNINSVADQSGGGYTVTQVNAFPQYNAVGFNGNKPAFVFGNLSALVTASGFPMGTGNTATMWVVGTLCSASGDSDARVLNYTAPSALDYSNAGSWLLYRPGTSTTQITFMRNSSAATATPGAFYPTPYRFICTVDSAGVKTLYVNGVSGASNSTFGNWISGGVAAIGRSGSAGNYWSGPVAEAGISTNYSDATAVAALDTYLKTKWGL